MINLLEEDKVHINALIDQKLLSMTNLDKRRQKNYVKYLKKLKQKLKGE